MAQKYVLGPNAARQLKKLLRGSGEVSRRHNLDSGLAFGPEYANPYAVQWAQSANNGDGGWIIWLPSDALLVVDGVTIDVREDLESVGGDYPDGWFLLGDVIEADGTLYLEITFSDPEGPTASFSNGETDDEDDEIKVIHVAVCDVATDASTGARSVHQFVTSTILLDKRTVEVDNRSIDKNGGRDGEHKVQIAHFNDTEKDSGKGLEKRLKADPETGEITARDSEGLMLVARKDGQVIYIPLKGDGEDPEAERDPKSGCDDHPGGGDAVIPGGEDEEKKHGGGYSGGGVPAESEWSVPGFGAASCCD